MVLSLSQILLLIVFGVLLGFIVAHLLYRNSLLRYKLRELQKENRNGKDEN